MRLAFPTGLRRSVRYSGRLKVVETTGQWGVYAGERIVLGDGMAIRDDLGLRLRTAFQPGAADAVRRGDSISEAFEIPNVEIKIKRQRWRRSDRAWCAFCAGVAAAATLFASRR